MPSWHNVSQEPGSVDDVVFLWPLLVQVTPVFGQDPSIDSDPAMTSQDHRGDEIPGDTTEQSLAFEQTEFPVNQEGYVSLSWNEVPGASEYVLLDDSQRIQYRGAFPVAFVSGLSNGTYPFHVQAKNADGDVIATTQVPAVVEVQHWPMKYASGLFFVGLAVFLILVFLITWGSWRAPPARDEPSEDHS
ncbi:signal peptide protein [Rhodopirellula maiorica SM1]|uniref:Signal peptide protein n=2 Tax=Novipirellula TaxID=2795426 RepID=M5REM9_9BACT|nr:signal peptide protein [Rhodopirellula maiorica SM1]